jgi:hypothetical protein
MGTNPFAVSSSLKLEVSVAKGVDIIDNKYAPIPRTLPWTLAKIGLLNYPIKIDNLISLSK